MTPDAQVIHERALELAEKDLVSIALLLDCPGWTYLQRRLSEKRDQLRDAIADDNDLTDAQTRQLRHERKILSDILRLPHQDRQAHQGTIANAKAKAAGPSRG